MSSRLGEVKTMQTAQAKTQYKTKPRRPSAQPKKRVVKMDGNVAYVSNGFASKKVQQPRSAVKRQIKVKQKKKTGLASTLLVLFIAFCALALLVSRYAAVCSIGSANNELERRIEATEAKIDNLAVDLELKDNLEHIHSSAQDELGMEYPDQSQRITISLDG